jgi:hypothetical protein
VLVPSTTVANLKRRKAAAPARRAKRMRRSIFLAAPAWRRPILLGSAEVPGSKGRRAGVLFCADERDGWTI